MKTLGKFEHIDATSVEQAVSLLKQYGDKAWLVAGGTDIIGTMRFEILEDYPEVLVNLKSVNGLDHITEENGTLKIGPLARLQDIARSDIVRAGYQALSQAAARTASPHVREMGTIGGNICQLIRCWYFRKEENRFDCIRKGGRLCHAVLGDNRYHSIFGAVRVGDPPCAQYCPAGPDIPGYLASVRDGDIAAAAASLIEYNPLASITGRICPRFCERECNRSELDEAVSIRSVERAVGDYLLDHADRYYASPRKETAQNVAIVGSGPAGLAAAYYLRKQGYGVTVYEAFEKPGGMLTYGIPAYRLQKADVSRLVEALENMGIRFLCTTTVGQDVTLAEIKKEYQAVFCATGAWQQPSLGLEGEDLLASGLEFLTRVNQGLRKMKAKKVLVIGGGSVAMDVAITARRLGADVTVTCLECESEMPALQEEVDQAVREGITILPSWGPARVIKKNDTLTGMELKRCVTCYDADHRFAPVYDTATTQQVEAGQIIMAIGQRPDLSFAGDTLKSARGLIVTEPETGKTNLTGVFAGGDATASPSTAYVVGAIAAGRQIAESINRFLGGKPARRPERKIENLKRSPNEVLESLGRLVPPTRAASELSLTSEDAPSVDLDLIETETKRCLNCGCDGVNPSDLAPALVAFDATIVTSGRTIKADDFWAADRGMKSTVLENDEVITEIRIPKPKPGFKSSFIKFAMRKSIDFPIVNCAALIESKNGIVKSARICLNAVYSNPRRAREAEKAIIGKPLAEAGAEAAGEAAVADAVALPYNKFKIQIAKTMVKRAILGCLK